VRARPPASWQPEHPPHMQWDARQEGERRPGRRVLGSVRQTVFRLARSRRVAGPVGGRRDVFAAVFMVPVVSLVILALAALRGGKQFVSSVV